MARDGTKTKGVPSAFIAAVAVGKSVPEAAELAGMSRRTAYRRMEDPEVKAAIANLRNEITSQALGQLIDGIAEAISVLRELHKCDNPSIRLGASRSFLTTFLEFRKQTELEQLLSEGERQLREGGGQTP